MKLSVLIIAHNEESRIKRCIESVLRQTTLPGEVVVLVHNSTDKTLEIVKSLPVTSVSFDGPKGIASARLEGLRHVSGDIILFLDGDAIVQANWVEAMSDTLKQKGAVLVGSWVKFTGTVFGDIYNWYSKYGGMLPGQDIGYWIWGGSSGFWGKDKEVVRDILGKSAILSSAVGLPRNPEDYWVALFMRERGIVARTNRTWISIATKESSSWEMFIRRAESLRNRGKMRAYFTKLVRAKA